MNALADEARPTINSEFETMKPSMSLGDRMKLYEEPSTARRAYKGQPLIVRLDGDNFSTFTKGLAKPFDYRFTTCMQELMVGLVERYQATVGYVQSDEITLVWYETPDSSGDYPFAGRFQKLESQLPSWAAARFAKLIDKHLQEKSKAEACFDARAFVVPTLVEAYNAVLWRQQDAVKNAISSAAVFHCGHKAVLGMNSKERQEKMFNDAGVNFNDYDWSFKRGTFARREKVFKELDPLIVAKLKPEHRPTGPIERSEVVLRDIWLSKQEDPVATLLFGGPIVEAP
jgi:tRNA(His) 5'-end guanylyltransferase